MHTPSFSLTPSISCLALLLIAISNIELSFGIPVRLNSTVQGFRVLTPTSHHGRSIGTYGYGFSSTSVNNRRIHSRSKAMGRRIGGIGYTPISDPATDSSPSKSKSLTADSSKLSGTSLWRWRGIVSPGPVNVSPGTGAPHGLASEVNSGDERIVTKDRRQPDQGDPRNTVVVDSEDEYCLIVPISMSTDIGDSEQPGGTTAYCSSGARYSQGQGVFSPDFWSVVEYETGEGRGGGRWAQLTGCINPETLDRLDPDDAGGQYDSSGGTEGRGNPEGSVCRGYNHFVELIEPAGARACIRCCDDEDDCPVHRDTEGCPSVIPGNYFTCDVDGDGNDERFPPQIGNGGDDEEGDDDDGDEDGDDGDDRK